jgi:hypothetical protein
MIDPRRLRVLQAVAVAAYCKRIASLCTGPGAGFREAPKSFNHAK